MEYTSISDIFTVNLLFRQRLLETLAEVKPEEADVVAPGEKWTIQQVAEHVSLVGSGIARICGSLLEASKTDAKPADGSFRLSEEFGSNAAKIATMKLEAPEMVAPSGKVSIEEAIDRLERSMLTVSGMQDDLQRYDVAGHTFPHPYFGELTAAEWLVVLGRHEDRHRRQIRRMLTAIRQ